jgi:hypothetical protein
MLFILCAYVEKYYPPLDNAGIELHQIMALEIKDVGFQTQVHEDETIDQFHNID